jgi:hypothetical protein
MKTKTKKGALLRIMKACVILKSGRGTSFLGRHDGKIPILWG